MDGFHHGRSASFSLSLPIAHIAHCYADNGNIAHIGIKPAHNAIHIGNIGIHIIIISHIHIIIISIIQAFTLCTFPQCPLLLAFRH